MAAAENAAKDAQLAQAQILVAVLRISNYDIERGEAALQNVSHLDGLSEAQLVLAQSVGPMALAYAGRPDGVAISRCLIRRRRCGR
ncbi:MAG: hypothetical protein R3E66_21765 [bacterium]